MSRIFNFGAGPSMLPDTVVQSAANLFQDCGNGIGVAELSHRSKEYLAIHEACIYKLRTLLQVPATHKILLVPGGATTQFALIPMNVLNGHGHAAYVITGSWSSKAAQHAEKTVDASRIHKWNALKECPDGMPTAEWIENQLAPNSDIYDYIHVTTNNTIRGSQYCLGDCPIRKSFPVVADCSSDILSRPIDWNHFRCVYAGAQKNLGIAGVAVVIIREDFLNMAAAEKLPPMLAYRTHLEQDSLYNTPPTFPIVVMKLMLDWVESHGGLKRMEEIAEERSAMVYEALRSFEDHYELVIKQPKFRSKMNLTFTIRDDADGSKTESFLNEAKAEGLVGLKGHRSVGGIRASMYNAMPIDGAERLSAFLYRWAQR